MSSNAELEECHKRASMPSLLVLDVQDSHTDVDTEGEQVSDPSISKGLARSPASIEAGVSKLETVSIAPRTVKIRKPATPVSNRPSSTASTASPTGGKASTPRRQLQFLCDNGRVVAPPLAVGPSKASSPAPKKVMQQSGADPASTVSEEQPGAAAEAVIAALPTVPATSDNAENHVGISAETSQLVRSAFEGVPPKYQRSAMGCVSKGKDTNQSVDAVGSQKRLINVVNTEGRLVKTVGGVNVQNVNAVNALDVVEAVGALVRSTGGALVEPSAAAAVLDAVEAGSTGAVSHVVFESGGRAVGALMPGEDGQQVVLAGQQGDKQVVLAVDRNVLGTAAGGDGKNIILEVDEASDSVTLLVNRPSEEAVYELASEGGELLELWERDSDGKDRHLETVTETSLVDIRAVCEQCGCAISHHMVGLLARADGTDYGFRCRQCQFVQTDVEAMARHMDSHRPSADTQCRFCSRGLRAFKPQPSQTFTCHACELVFTSRHEMIKHREVHPPKRRFPCEMCDKAFQVKVQLEVHMRTHLGHKPYACDVCPAAFTQPSHLINHRRTHTGERPYTCKFCGRAFVQQGHLRSHERTHTGERPYKCNVCGRGFRQSGQLSAHKKVHEGDTPPKLRRRVGEPISLDEITCRECDKTFKLPKDLKRHMLIHAEGTFKCETCGRPFKRADHLRRHRRQHENPRKRKKRRPRPTPTEEKIDQQEQGLTVVDGVMDSVLNDPERQQSTEVVLQIQEDHGEPKVEEEIQDDDSGWNDSIGHQEGNNGLLMIRGVTEDPSGDTENQDVHTRISLAPKDALWSQPDNTDDVRWQRVARRSSIRPAGKEAYGRRSRLLDMPPADDWVDDEMEMLTEMLKGRAKEARKPRHVRGRPGRGVPYCRRYLPNPPEKTVKLEPVDSELWEPSENKQHIEGGDNRADEKWSFASLGTVKTERKSFHIEGSKRADDLVLTV